MSATLTPAALIALIGPENARLLVEAKGGERLTLPSLDAFNRAVLRNAAIWSAYQRIGHPGGHDASSAFYAAMAREHRLTQSQVRRIVGNMRGVGKVAG